jgi:undecaprenyl diphosphate synthase
VRETVKWCVEKNVEVLTLFAFSSENWQRPEKEVSYLMELFVMALEREVKKLHKQNIQLRIIGDRTRFDIKMQIHMQKAEALTANNTGLKLVIAANYGGQWDITEACRELAREVESGKITSADITPELLTQKLTTVALPPPDLFIRTSGERRISNFMIWQLAYTEMFFTDVLWPDFDAHELDKALEFFLGRERRFGCISEQLRAKSYA